MQGQTDRLASGEYADMVMFDTRGRMGLGEILENSALAETIAVFIGRHSASFPHTWYGKLTQFQNCSHDPRDLCGQQCIVCGTEAQHGLDQLLRQDVYTIDDARICRPQQTDDCIER